LGKLNIWTFWKKLTFGHFGDFGKIKHLGGGIVNNCDAAYTIFAFIVR